MKYGRHLAYFRAAFFDIGNTCFNQVHGQIPPANIDAVHRLQEKGFHYEPYFEKLLDVAITYSGHRNTDLIPAGVTKATGIHQLDEAVEASRTRLSMLGISEQIFPC
mgnify:CR=1 FL=1